MGFEGGCWGLPWPPPPVALLKKFVKLPLAPKKLPRLHSTATYIV